MHGLLLPFQLWCSLLSLLTGKRSSFLAKSLLGSHVKWRCPRKEGHFYRMEQSSSCYGNPTEEHQDTLCSCLIFTTNHNKVSLLPQRRRATRSVKTKSPGICPLNPSRSSQWSNKEGQKVFKASSNCLANNVRGTDQYIGGGHLE